MLGSVIVIVGALVYPLPGSVILISKTCSFATPALPFAGVLILAYFPIWPAPGIIITNLPSLAGLPNAIALNPPVVAVPVNVYACQYNPS